MGCGEGRGRLSVLSDSGTGLSDASFEVMRVPDRMWHTWQVAGDLPMISVVKYAFVAAIGAVGMYWFDVAQGRRGQRYTRRAGDVARDAGQGLQRTVYRSHALIRSNEVSDDILMERVRRALRRATAHSDAIDVSCSRGVVILRGAVLKHEHPRIMRAARSAAGASVVYDELAAYRHLARSPSRFGLDSRRAWTSTT